ncbi:MAG: hypothetical protein AB1779_10265 [Candidatus Thermoplasmatota archaeon]
MKGLKGLLDTGSDKSYISPIVASELKIEEKDIFVNGWYSSNEHRAESPTIIELIIKVGKNKALLPHVFIDDRSLDKEAGEDVIVGLDFLQATKMTIKIV